MTKWKGKTNCLSSRFHTGMADDSNWPVFTCPVIFNFYNMTFAYMSI